MEPSATQEAASCAELQHFMQSKGSSQNSQDPSISAYHVPHQSSQYQQMLSPPSSVLILSANLLLALPSGLFPSGFPTVIHKRSSSPFILHDLPISSSLT
jgi:hypothetical protein